MSTDDAGHRKIAKATKIIPPHSGWYFSFGHSPIL